MGMALGKKIWNLDRLRLTSRMKRRIVQHVNDTYTRIIVLFSRSSCSRNLLCSLHNLVSFSSLSTDDTSLPRVPETSSAPRPAPVLSHHIIPVPLPCYRIGTPKTCLCCDMLLGTWCSRQSCSVPQTCNDSPPKLSRLEPIDVTSASFEYPGQRCQTCNYPQVSKLSGLILAWSKDDGSTHVSAERMARGCRMCRGGGTWLRKFSGHGRSKVMYIWVMRHSRVSVGGGRDCSKEALVASDLDPPSVRHSCAIESLAQSHDAS
jgi:hypothetical protein